jgi:hypothetical protein
MGICARCCRQVLPRLACLVAALPATWSASPACGEDFRAFTWGVSDTADTPNLSPMVWVAQDSNINVVAEQVKALPIGLRYLLMFGFVNDLADNPADRCIPGTIGVTGTSAPVGGIGSVHRMAPQLGTLEPTGSAVPFSLTKQRGPWMDNGIAAVQARMQVLIAELARRGADADGFVFDNETTLHATNFLAVPGAFGTIQADPRWPALSEQLALPFDISSLQVMYWGSPLYYQWTEVMAGRFDDAMNTAVYLPIRSIYPLASVSNFNSGMVTAGNESPDITGKMDRYATSGFGTHDSGEHYGGLTPQRIAATTALSLPFAGDAWIALRLEVHKMRGLLASNATRPKYAWIAPRSYIGLAASVVKSGFAGTPYWDELVLQLGMGGIDTFLDWNPDGGEAQLPGGFNHREDRVALDALLCELDAEVGPSDTTPLLLAQPSWSDRVLASARFIAPDVLWRFSFDAGIGSVDVRFTDGTTATVFREPGRAGGWLRHPVWKKLVMDRGGALPVMTLHP